MQSFIKLKILLQFNKLRAADYSGSPKLVLTIQISLHFRVYFLLIVLQKLTSEGKLMHELLI